MRYIKRLLAISTLIINVKINAQTITPHLQAIDNWKLINRSAERINEDGKKGIRLSEAPGDGAMILKEFAFANGTIELDIKGKNIMQQSFVGVVFHGVDTNGYDAIYFRPFNFANADTARRSRAVQYISMPDYPWEKLRQNSLGKYENKVFPVPNPDGWFHVKIIISGKHVKVFVDNADKPSLEVDTLSDATKGGFAFVGG